MPSKQADSLAFTVILVSLVALTVCSYDIFVPNLVMMQNHFKTTEFNMQMSVMMAPFISSFSGLFYGHFADSRGRKPVMQISLVLLAIGSLISAFSGHSLTVFMIGRCFQSFGSGGLLNIAVVMLGDMFKGARYAKAIATISMLFPITYAVAPNFGAFLGKFYGWESNFIFMAFASIVFMAFFQYFIKETLVEKIHNDEIINLFNRIKGYIKLDIFFIRTIIHSLPIMVPTMFVTTNSFLFVAEFGLTPEMFAFLQLIPISAGIISTSVYKHTIDKMGFQKSYLIGIIIISIFLICTVSFIILGIQTIFSILLLNSIFLSGMCFIATSAATQAFDSRTTDKGIGIAFVSMIRNIFMATGVVLVSYFYNKTAFPLYWIISFVAVSIIALYIYLQRLNNLTSQMNG